MDDASIIHFYQLNCSAHEHFFDFPNRFGWVEFFRAHINAVHDRVAAEQSVWVVQIVQTCRCVRVARVGDETVGGQQTRWADEFIRIPPE